jgi:hypothetical protein
MKIYIIAILVFTSHLISAQDVSAKHETRSTQIHAKFDASKSFNQMQVADYSLPPLSSFSAQDTLQDRIPKLTFNRQYFFYTRDNFTGQYIMYSNLNGELKAYNSYFNAFDFTAYYSMPGPIGEANGYDFAGAIIRSVITELNYEVKIGKTAFVLF